MTESANQRVIALDVGDVRVGVAVSDVMGLIAQPLEVYKRIGYNPDCKYVLSLCERFETKHLVLGLPLNMDGSQGEQARKIIAFGDKLKEAGLTVDYQDERMTTITAEQALVSGNMHRADRKKTVDKVAAAIILQQWLASRQA